MQHIGSIMTIHTTFVSVSNLEKQLNWPPFSARRLQRLVSLLFYKICHQNITIPTPPPPPLITNTHQNYMPHLEHKRKQLQIQTTQHISKHIQIQLLPLNNHRLEFTATQSVYDSNDTVLQGRPNPSSPPSL